MPLNRSLILTVLFGFLLLSCGQAGSKYSGPVLLELFTSQGCSSCPPAERWIGDLVDDPKLWNDVVPVVWHVDYWDRLGWKDPFAENEFSERQYQYRRNGAIRSVYTPGFVANGREWRGWFQGKNVPSGLMPMEKPEITIEQEGEFFKIRGTSKHETILNLVITGSGMNTKVTSGENHGRRLNQNFVVLNHKTFKIRGDFSENFEIPANLPNATKYAVSYWVTSSLLGEPTEVGGFWID